MPGVVIVILGKIRGFLLRKEGYLGKWFAWGEKISGLKAEGRILNFEF